MRVLLLVLLMAGAGCSTPCEDLARKICSCQPGQTAIDSCNRRASDQNGKTPPSDDAEKLCQDLLDGCDCHALTTPEGQRACGLAEPISK